MVNGGPFDNHVYVVSVCDWQGEGVAYRGRALLEIKTDLGELPELPVDDINNDDLLRVQVSLPVL